MLEPHCVLNLTTWPSIFSIFLLYLPEEKKGAYAAKNNLVEEPKINLIKNGSDLHHCAKSLALFLSEIFMTKSNVCHYGLTLTMRFFIVLVFLLYLPEEKKGAHADKII